MTLQLPEWNDETEFDPYVSASNIYAADMRELQTLYQASDDMFAITTRGGLITWTNPAWRINLGWRPTELQAQAWGTLVHPDDAELMMDTIVKMFREHCVYVTARMKRSDGVFVKLNFKVSPWTLDGHAFNRARLSENADVP